MCGRAGVIFGKKRRRAEEREYLAWLFTCMLIKCAHTLAAHCNQILTYYDYRISTGPLERTNSKIRVLQHRTYGFRDIEFFKLKIYALHETRFKLIG